MLLFVSHLIPLSTTASLSHHISLSLTVGYSGVGHGFSVEVRLGKSDRRGMVAISRYFWVHFLGSWVCGGVVWWFAAACS